MYWWTYPSRITLFILIPIYLGCASMDLADYALYNVPEKHLEGAALWLGLASLVAFAAASWMVEPRTLPRQINPQVFSEVTLNRAMMALYIVVLAAYAIFLYPLVDHPELITELAAGNENAMFELRETLNRVPGITTLSTLQSLCIVFSLGYFRFTGKPQPKRFKVLMVVLIFVCLLRVWLWSERLAFLEILMPACLMTFALPGARKRRWLILAPVYGVAIVFAIFCAGEYFRSWQTYQYTSNYSFPEFAWIRFIGYYTTALNNGAALYGFLDTHYIPTNTASWFYKFPLWTLLDVHFDVDLAYTKQTLLDFLATHGNEEFFNPSGVFMPLCDFGPILGVFCWAVLGAISGKLFRGFVNLSPLGLVLYPVWYIGVLEILRVFYWGDGRFFPVIVGSFIITSYLNKKSLKERYMRRTSGSLQLETGSQ